MDRNNQKQHGDATTVLPEGAEKTSVFRQMRCLRLTICKSYNISVQAVDKRGYTCSAEVSLRKPRFQSAANRAVPSFAV